MHHSKGSTVNRHSQTGFGRPAFNVRGSSESFYVTCTISIPVVPSSQNSTQQYCCVPNTDLSLHSFFSNARISHGRSASSGERVVWRGILTLALPQVLCMCMCCASAGSRRTYHDQQDEPVVNKINSLNKTPPASAVTYIC